MRTSTSIRFLITLIIVGWYVLFPLQRITNIAAAREMGYDISYMPIIIQGVVAGVCIVFTWILFRKGKDKNENKD